MGNALAGYRRILALVDLSDDSHTIARRASGLAAIFGAELELLHVVEFVPVEPLGETLMPAVEIEEERIDRASARLRTLAADIGMPGAAIHIEGGHVKTEILRVARERAVDLI